MNVKGKRHSIWASQNFDNSGYIVFEIRGEIFQTEKNGALRRVNIAA